MEANTPGSEDPKHISEPLGRVVDSLLEPHEGDADRREQFTDLSTQELESLLLKLLTKVKNGEASADDLSAIDDLTITLKAAKRESTSEDNGH